MKRRRLGAMLLCVGMLSGCAWLTPPDVSGRWEGTARLKMMIDGPQTYEIALRLTEADGVITGTLQIGEWSALDSVTGSLEGRHVEMTSAGIVFEGEVHGRAMSGTCTRSEVTDTWEVTRVD